MKTNLSLRALGTTSAIAMLIVVGGLAIGYWQYTNLEVQTTSRMLDRVHSMQTYVLEQKEGRLLELSSVLANDAHFSSYITQALDGNGDGSVVDTVSIRDLLDQRRQDLGLDTAAIVNGAKRVIATAGDGVTNNRDLANEGLVRRMSENSTPVAGPFKDASQLLWASLTPLRAGDGGAALLVALRLDTTLMKDIARTTNADIAIVGIDTQLHTLSSSLDSGHAARLSAAIEVHHADLVDSAAKRSRMNLHVNLGDANWNVQAAPFGGQASGLLLLSLVHTDAAAGDLFHGIALPIFAGVTALLILLLLLVGVAWRAFLSPLSSLLRLSERAVKGDYDMVYRERASGTIGRLGDVFNHLLNDLRRFRPTPGAPRRRSTDRK